MPYAQDDTVVTVNRHLKDRELEQIGRLLGQTLGRNKDHADMCAFNVSAGKSPNRC